MGTFPQTSKGLISAVHLRSPLTGSPGLTSTKGLAILQLYVKLKGKFCFFTNLIKMDNYIIKIIFGDILDSLLTKTNIIHILNM